MGRALRALGLSGLIVLGLVEARAFAQDADKDDDTNANDTQADTHHNTEEPKSAEHPAPVHEPSSETTTPPTGAIAPTPPPVLPKTRPKVGDLTITGYFRGGYGATLKET